MFKQPMLKRLLKRSVIVIVFICLISLAACGNASGSGSSGSSSTPTTPSSAPFKVTSIDMVVNPTSIAGIACGTSVTVTYTATIHVAANSPGGTVKFYYTVNNGRGQNPASIDFNPGETTKAYTFTWSGALPLDHTYPEQGGIQVTSPNQLISSLVGPTGRCTALAAFQVTSVDMTVSPPTIQGLACGTSIVVTYTATIHVAANSPGGTVKFYYTVNNGRGQNPASIDFNPGETTKAYTFTWSGALPLDHTYPEQGGIQVTSPNQVTSPTVKPTGTCTSTAAFKVTSIDLSVSPNSIVGKACNTTITFTYTVTFHIAPNSPGGTIQFAWTVNNGRSQTNASVTAGPGETTVTYTFTSAGTLYSDHTFPDVGIVLTSSPNMVESPQVIPAGTCV